MEHRLCVKVGETGDIQQVLNQVMRKQVSFSCQATREVTQRQTGHIQSALELKHTNSTSLLEFLHCAKFNVYVPTSYNRVAAQ